MGYKWFWLAGRLVILVASLAFIALAAPIQADEPDGYLPDEVVVKLAQAGDLLAVAADYGLDPTPLDQFGAQPIFRLRIGDGADPLDKAAALVNDSRVVYAEPNFFNQTPEGRKKSSWATDGNGDEYAEQWAGDKIRLPAAHSVTRGAGVTVAVLDTGVDAGHPLLAGRLVPGYDFVDLDNDPSEVGDHDQEVVFGHGTHVAGLVALAAPEAKIMPVRVLDRDGTGNIWVLAEALAYAVDPDGDPATNDGAQVINLSLSTTQPTNLLAEIVAVVTCDDDHDGVGDDDCSLDGGRGVVIVAAAGNSGTDLPEYPAAEGVAGSLAVAASTPADTLADFSARGSWVHLAAPGENILSSVPGGDYGVWNGTSMAAPLVAGAAALVRAANPNLNAVQISDQIIATAATIDGPVPRRIDAAAALGLPLETTPPDTLFTLTGTPPDPSASTSATFSFTGSDNETTAAALRFECRLDSQNEADFMGCSSPQTYTNLSIGTHTFDVRAIDLSDNLDPTPASYIWMVEAPLPCGPTITLSADADAWIEQNSPSNNKGDDSILKVQSKGPNDNFRALVRFALPASVPDGCIVESATLRLFAVSAASGRTLHALRLASSWMENGITWSNQPATTGPAATTNSGSGYREWDITAQVQAEYDTGTNYGFLIRDAAEGNSDAAQQFHSREKGQSMPQLVLRFGVAPPADTTPPQTTIGSGPDATTSSTGATFTFLADEPGSTFECSLDGMAFAACTSPQEYTGLSAGGHVFGVRAIDPSGNIEPGPAIYLWTIEMPADTTPPETTIVLGPEALTTATNATFTFSADKLGSTFECSLDGTAFTACTSPQAYLGLNVGLHTFAARAIDLTGNVDPTPAVASWTITLPPQPPVVSCGQVLMSSILVTNNLIDCPGDGLVIGADGITLDLNGHTIDGVGLGVGVRNDGFDSVIITNGTVQEFDFGVQLNPGTALNVVSSLTVQLNQDAGIQLSDADDGMPMTGNTIRNNTIGGNETGIALINGTQGTLAFGNTVGINSDYSLHLVSTSGNVLEANLITGSSDVAVLLEDASSNTLIGNTISDSSDSAVAILAGSNDNRIESNTLTGGGDAGIFIADSGGNELIANTVHNMIDTAVVLENAHGNIVASNDLRFNAGGLQLSAATGNRLESNDVSGSTGTGIEIDDSFENVIIQNTANDNRAEGISIDALASPGTGNLLDRNRANGNSGNGIYVGQGGHIIIANTADNNHSWGIYAAAGNTDGRDNRAAGNSEPLQCFGVSCNGSGPPPPDATPPDTTISDAPPNPSLSSSATFSFSGNDNLTAPTALAFECRLDNQDEADFIACSSPQSYADLSIGMYTFDVRAVDSAGNADPTPASYTWTIETPADTTPPETTIDSGPDVTTTSTDATFTFSANEPSSTFECALDGAAFASCISPVGYMGLNAGAHTFQVRAIDQAANIDPTPASHTWTVSPPPDCGSLVTLPADADAWVDQNSSSNNFGSDSILKVQAKSSNNFRALVRFALPTSVPQGCIVQSATLRLYAASSKNGRTLQAIQIAGSWSENSITWGNQPPTTGSAATTSSGSGYREWSVAAQVQAIYDTGANNGFLIRDATESGSGSEQQFHSREKGENPPELVISFAPAGG
jgi:parallel beta-helix repeat protein